MNRLIFLILVLMCSTLAAIAQNRLGDTAKWNGKWDPNDPACPCYKVQKQAEKEYQEMLKEEMASKKREEPFYVRLEKKYQKWQAEKKAGKIKRNRKRKNNTGKPLCPLI